MRKQQAGFTLIELVVVIVILGILAAAAIPRFAGLQDDARDAVADGIIGAILSSAVIQLGINQGASSTFLSITNATGVSPGNNAVFAAVGAEPAPGETMATPGGNCTTGEDQIFITVCALGDVPGDGTCRTRDGLMPEGLCEG